MEADSPAGGPPQHVCIEAIPVVALVSFLIGTLLAYLFGLQAGKAR